MKLKKKTKTKSKKNIELRVNNIEIEFAEHNAICGERYKNQIDTLKRIEASVKKNSEAIEKLFSISNKGLGAIKILFVIGSAIVGFFSYFNIFKEW